MNLSALRITPKENSLPEINEIQCPIESFVACLGWFERNELAAHLSYYHPDYHEDPEPYFEEARVRRFA